MIPWLSPGDPFPAVSRALAQPNGLLAAGADLSVSRLLDAYRHGIFPWFSEDEPILWWSPDPRMVLFPAELRVTRSLEKTLRNRPYDVRTDTAFRAVMRACAAPRPDAAGTWISPAVIEAYCRLHEAGWAHSVETWIDDELAGGFYGVAIGRMFYGESMFTRARDASKIALAQFVAHADALRVDLIDCQMSTAHLASLGAREIPRAEFSARIAELVHSMPSPGPWNLRVRHEGPA